jgi:hypothetical protein
MSGKCMGHQSPRASPALFSATQKTPRTENSCRKLNHSILSTLEHEPRLKGELKTTRDAGDAIACSALLAALESSCKTHLAETFTIIGLKVIVSSDLSIHPAFELKPLQRGSLRHSE